MADEAAFEACAALVRRADPDRYFSALFAPPAPRARLWALYAFNVETARIAESVREPMLGRIRLEWWRETLDAARAGKPRNHDVARAMAAVFAAADLPAALFAAMIDAREHDLSAESFSDSGALEDYVDATSGNLIRLAARVLGAGQEIDDAAREAGLAYGLVGIVRAVPFHAQRNKVFLPADLLHAAGLSADDVLSTGSGGRLASVARILAERARTRLAAARARRLPRAVLPAFLPASLVPLYLRRLARVGFDPFRAVAVPVHRRQMRLLRASLAGRL